MDIWEPMLDAFLERFRDFAEWWYALTWWIQDPLAGFWTTLVNIPVLGAVLLFFETYFGRGPTI